MKNIENMKMQDVLPKEILELEDLYSNVTKEQYRRFKFTFQDIWEITIDEVKEDRSINMDSILVGDLITIFLYGLLKSFKWEIYIRKDDESHKEFLLKFADILVENGGYRTIGNWEEPCCDFWRTYREVHDEKKCAEFMRKINAEMKNIEESNEKDKIEQLLQRTGVIFKSFCSMSIKEDEKAIEELEKATKTLLNLCTKYKYRLDWASEFSNSLTSIFGKLDSIEIKSLIIKYLIEYTDYFEKLEWDNSECVINVEYPNYSRITKSEFFRLYLENAVLLKRSDIYSGEVLDKVLTKLFCEFSAERRGESSPFGEDSPEDFLETLLVIGKICKNPDNLKLLLDSDFFSKIIKKFKFFIFEYYRKVNPSSADEDLNIQEKKMKLRFLGLCVIAQKQKSLDLNQTFRGKTFRIKK